MMRAYAEDAAAMALIQWRDLHVKRYPELGLLFAIPNGGYRNAREAARLKAMGVRAGVSDYFLPVPRLDGTAGLWIELKAGKGRTTTNQEAWLAAMRYRGYWGRVAHGWLEAARIVCEYLGIPECIPEPVRRL